MTDRTQPSEVVRAPAFETLPSGADIAHWFVDEMRHVHNVGGDAWWLARTPHSACRKLAFVDYDTQEFWLLEVVTDGSSDLLWVTNGYDGFGFLWWRNPTPRPDYYWHRDGLVWMADQLVLHVEYRPLSSDEGQS